MAILRIEDENGWRYSIEITTVGLREETRLYALRQESTTDLPERDGKWIMVTDNIGFIVLRSERYYQ